MAKTTDRKWASLNGLRRLLAFVDDEFLVIGCEVSFIDCLHLYGKRQIEVSLYSYVLCAYVSYKAVLCNSSNYRYDIIPEA